MSKDNVKGKNLDRESGQVEPNVIPPICNRCKQPIMPEPCEYEIFEYKTIGGYIKTCYCCLICQMEMAV
jgi:hypothetical protein